MKLFLIRHTSTACPAGLCYGRTEVPLADTFREEAAAVRAALPPHPWRFFSSPASRCRRLAEYLGGPVQIDPRLQELDFGSWENRPWAELPREDTESWLGDFVHRRPPGGESFGDLAGRACGFLKDLSACPASPPIVVVTHAGVIRALLALAQGQALADAFARPIAFGCVQALNIGPDRLVSLP